MAVTTTELTSRPRAALAGLVAAGVALGAGEFVAGGGARWRSPVEAVAEAVIDLAPKAIADFGIRTFGQNDKIALVIGTIVVLALLAPLVGIAAARRRIVGVVAFAGLAVVGALAALRTPGGGGAETTIPSIAAGLVGIGALFVLLAVARGWLPGTRPAPTTTPSAVSTATSGGPRRNFLVASVGLAGLAATAAAGGRALRERFSATRSRNNLVLPSAPETLPALPASVEVGVDGVEPFVTPNGEFYRIDTALLVPQVPVETWSLRIHGMVDQELELSFDELADRGLVEADITLTCVSNPVGGRLVGHARWLGVPLATLLDEVGVDPAADQLVGRSADDYTCGFPVSAAYDRTALVAIGMNGEPLPLEHGFPARLITSGLYGYVSATKWLTEIELTTFDAFDAYWIPRGYAVEAPVKTQTRIDVPRSGTVVAAGPAVVAGVAWAQSRGIERVEVSIDDGPFAEADLAEEANIDSWRQWRFDWDATPGPHRIVVRSTDGTGELQTEERTEILPDGASGWLSQLVTVTDRG